MPRTLVTGATGLIGSHVVRALVRRGDTVVAAVRPRSPLEALEDVDVERVTCDVLDRRAVRRALEGVERVFHCAGSASLAAEADDVFRVNVTGTRNVLGACLDAGVERVVHTSSIAALGPAPRGKAADETNVFRAGRFGLPYVDAKHEAELEALRLAAAGLPVVIVNPAHVLGPGDLHRSSTELVRRFLRREIPVFVDGAICIVHVEDVAAGMLLADERGRPGERYVLGNRNFTLDRLFADLGRLSGVAGPALRLPLPAAMALLRSTRTVAAATGARPITDEQLTAMSLWWAFRSTKAKRELGYKPRHHEDALTDTIEWYREREGDRLRAPGTRQPLALRLAGFAERRTTGTWALLRRG